MQALRSSRLLEVFAFILAATLAFALMSHAAHGAPLQTQDAVYHASAAVSDVGHGALRAGGPILTVPPDPIDNPGGALESARAAYRDGGGIGLTLVICFLLVLLARRYVSWLQTGRRAVVVASILTALVTAIATFTGEGPTLAWLIGAVTSGVLLYLRPEAPPPAAPSTRAVTSPILFVLAAGLLLLTSCTGTQRSAVRHAGAAGVDAGLVCQQSSLTGLAGETYELARGYLWSRISGDGEVDTEAIRAAAREVRSDAGRCAFAAAMASLTDLLAQRRGALAVGPSPAQQMRQAFAEVQQFEWRVHVTVKATPADDPDEGGQ